MKTFKISQNLNQVIEFKEILKMRLEGYENRNVVKLSLKIAKPGAAIMNGGVWESAHMLRTRWRSGLRSSVTIWAWPLKTLTARERVNGCLPDTSYPGLWICGWFFSTSVVWESLFFQTHTHCGYYNLNKMPFTLAVLCSKLSSKLWGWAHIFSAMPVTEWAVCKLFFEWTDWKIYKYVCVYVSLWTCILMRLQTLC